MRGTQRSFCFPESDPFLRYSFYFLREKLYRFPGKSMQDMLILNQTDVKKFEKNEECILH